MMVLDDFVFDWADSFAFRNPDIEAGYVRRTSMATREEFAFVHTPSELPQDVLMIDRFADLAGAEDDAARAPCAHATLKAQYCPNAIWNVVRSQ